MSTVSETEPSAMSETVDTKEQQGEDEASASEVKEDDNDEVTTASELPESVLMKKVFPFFVLRERLSLSRTCKDWRSSLSPRDVEISRLVNQKGLMHLIDSKWSVWFKHDDCCGWDSVSVKLDYRGTCSSLKTKFPSRFTGICFGRWRLPRQWFRNDVDDQHTQLERVMRKYGLKKAQEGEGKLEFLKVIVGKNVLMEEIERLTS
uniref:F-box domain-containing protein n=1 Tax=Chromera velia CCMP2878 TaxID=1169474 RepID=A0A0G4HHI4_9ALVE|mmetsp:Transcript_56187/g.110030  ORF Transcript_56187/g.110030 Transcript_56187/m.110030 type:complete len:205 (+) Transcript_56187:107-721(+)|eukprot:Cvel_6890.t1-p1 / transcript=Cvel_6890.t1 / gene=Cvel_6890 / organism=Chromera_velia_CCMP2878 / gene_product=hypothetical protein / transcript_product=hypothetical protein / location=Cvel_scaffold348:64635-65246(-) / protein_length=204 / sequence_SO=supercontig / SO=protein_coding / is_pseudo=false